MLDNRKAHNANCHCGAVIFSVRLSGEFNSIRRCTCSYCRMRGAIAVSAQLADIEITQGQDQLKEYQFNTGAAKHYFCSNCGIYTHHQRRSNPEQYGVNVACIESVSPFDFEKVVVFDGVNHPSDNITGPSIAGVLRYVKSTQ
ncbi:MAG: GFA family protein [Granulosicoccaceae bacterium]